MSAVWNRWRGGRQLIHAHDDDGPTSLCGRRPTHDSIRAAPPSLQQLLDGDVCHHCHDRMTARAQLARLRGAA